MNPAPRTDFPSSRPGNPQPSTGTPAEPSRSQPTPGLRVDAETLRDDAAAVHGFADRVATAAAHPVRIVPTPRWATTVAATRATDTARQSLTALSQDIAETARRIRAVASDYEAADARAAARLRATR